MALDTAAKRLQWARRRHGKYDNPTDAARAFGWTVSTYLGHENGDRNPSRDAAKKYAKVYRVRWEWLLDAEGAPTAPFDRDVAAVPLLAWVSAGNLVSSESQIPVEDVPLLAFADLGRGEFFALKVEGDSMDRLSPDGSIIIVNRAERELLPGRYYVFSLRGETTFKRWQPEPPRLEPYSTNPANQTLFIKRSKDLEVVGRVKRTVLDL
jgi:SOS-response transcriptional repressor LexA